MTAEEWILTALVCAPAAWGAWGAWCLCKGLRDRDEGLTVYGGMVTAAAALLGLELVWCTI